jgi:hypothetical protein
VRCKSQSEKQQHQQEGQQQNHLSSRLLKWLSGPIASRQTTLSNPPFAFDEVGAVLWIGSQPQRVDL